MTHDATPDAARLRGWAPRRPSEAPAPPPEDAAARIGALLDELARARLGLSADLGVLASAVELGAYDVAEEVVDGTRDDLRVLGARLAASVPPAPAPAAPPPAVSLGRSRRRALRAALPAAPALAAAAALIGVLAGLTPAPRPAPAGPVQVDAAAASYAELYRLHERGGGEAALRDAAHELHAEVARVMALAASDPAAAEAALRELLGAVGAVPDAGARADLRSVLAESQRLLAALEAAVGSTTAAVEDARLPKPQPEVRPPLEEALRPAARPAPTPPAPGARQPGASSSTPSAAPSTTPSTAPAPSAEAQPTPTRSAEPRPTSPPLFPTQGSSGLLPRSLPEA
ncbi:MAG TPA: hypothetical protein VNU66_06075 [Mycobacteriales bacterium]|nr:hypothetical protein [Mycobacteriales bacterium]